jgi:hypothetical protein
MIVAVHQPNYAPWLGYFRKMALADRFVFLDDAAFSKGSVTNRVRILENGRPVWLTVPAKPPIGTPIRAVMPSQPDWPVRHLSRLQNAYRAAPAFDAVWPDMTALYDGLAALDLAEANRVLILRLAERIGVSVRWKRASELDPDPESAGDDRLLALIGASGGVTAYLSGRGGAKYQDDAKFDAAGIAVVYNDYTPPAYPQAGTRGGFEPGLSILDAVFHVGWDGVKPLLDLPGT